MSYAKPESLVETGWLAANLNRVKVLDASWYLPAQKRDAKAEFAAAHVPGAQFFDIDAISDRDTTLPHMLPSAEAFGRAVGALGVSSGDRVVIYDGAGLQGAARVWWTFRAFGHRDVAILNGGFVKWMAEKRPTESTVRPAKPARFHARLETSLVRDLAAMKANVTSKVEQVLDARPRGRFAGTEPEPRPGLRSGHIPGSRCLPSAELIDANAKTVRPAADLRALFTGAGIDLAKPIATTCGSGITASALAFGLYLVGHERWAVYDGSWAEWGAQADTPVATGT
ncbi:MAG: sulfurtransferase [Alphaproteobacteria bacterium]|nr:sulfurtransferase [Alphaproteobacteria bacterium]